MKRALFSSLLFAAGAAFAGTSVAGVLSLETGLRNVQFGVIDLTPNDGVAATFTVDSLSTQHYHAIDRYSVPGTDVLFTRTVTGQVPSNYEDTFQQAVAGSTAGGQVGQLGATASIDYSSPNIAIALSSIDQVARLTLAPHSVLTFSGTFYYDSLLTDSAARQPEAFPALDIYLQANGTYWSYDDHISGSVHGRSGVENFWLSVANTGSAATEVYLRIGIDSQVRLSPAGTALAVTPVPEPSAYAMLAAGLGIVAAFARRRRA